MPDYFVHESSYVDAGAVIGAGHQDLALLPHHAGRGHRGAVQPRPERGGDARDPAGQQREGPEQRVDLRGGRSSRTTSSAARVACSPTWSIRGATSPGSTSTARPGCAVAPRSGPMPRSSAASRSGACAFVGAGAVVTGGCSRLRADGRRARPPDRLDVPVRRPVAAPWRAGNLRGLRGDVS